MSRLVVLIVVVLLILGALFYLSTLPREQPTKTIEVEVPQGGNAS
jgi:ABC-type transporter Mla subunit MlaD